MIALYINAYSILAVAGGSLGLLVSMHTITSAVERQPVGWIRISITTFCVVILGLFFSVAGYASIVQSFWYGEVNAITVVIGSIILTVVLIGWTSFATIMIRNARYQKRERLRKENGKRLRLKLLKQSPFSLGHD